jgi:hypothetical protein
MSSCPELLDRLQSEQHVVQLYGTDDRLLTSNVGRFLAEGLKRGDGLLVIATPEHRSTLSRQLKEDQSYSKAVLEGRLVFLDAQLTLGRFMVDGEPSEELFHQVVGEALSGVTARAGHTGVRAYGEMVGLLWTAGARAAAIRLEGLWNQLLNQSQAILFCAYPIDVFGPDFDAETLDALLCSHTHLLPLDPALDQALAQALEEVLGPRLPGIQTLIQSNQRPAWGKVPGPESLVLWLRNNLPGSADRILDRARDYYRPSAS